MRTPSGRARVPTFEEWRQAATAGEQLQHEVGRKLRSRLDGDGTYQLVSEAHLAALAIYDAQQAGEWPPSTLVTV